MDVNMEIQRQVDSDASDTPTYRPVMATRSRLGTVWISPQTHLPCRFVFFPFLNKKISIALDTQQQLRATSHNFTAV